MVSVSENEAAGFTDVVFLKVGTTKTHRLMYGRHCRILSFLTIENCYRELLSRIAVGESRLRRSARRGNVLLIISFHFNGVVGSGGVASCGAVVAS